MIPRKTGRPRQFDTDQALLQAIDVFWKKGYDGASMGDLTSAMGINRPSLYAAFGDKHALYLKAIDYYIENNACEPLIAFEAESDITCAVRTFLQTSIDHATQQDAGKLGCFLGSCVPTNACELDGVQERLQQAIEQTDNRLAQRFETEKEKGILDSDFPSLERAYLMFDLCQGYVLRARSGIGRDLMLRHIESRVTTVLA